MKLELDLTQDDLNTLKRYLQHEYEILTNKKRDYSNTISKSNRTSDVENCKIVIKYIETDIIVFETLLNQINAY